MIDLNFRDLYIEKETTPGGYHLRYSTHFGVVSGGAFSSDIYPMLLT